MQIKAKFRDRVEVMTPFKHVGARSAMRFKIGILSLKLWKISVVRYGVVVR